MCGPPDGNLVLQLAKEYGQSPDDVENWSEYWFERAAVKMHGESLDNARRLREMPRVRK